MAPEGFGGRWNSTNDRILQKIQKALLVMIPLIDLTLPKRINDRIKREIARVIDSHNYILGAKVESFEKKFANYCGVRYAIGVGNGTDAIRLALRALGIGKGDRVLTVALTSPFTALAIVEEGAIPVFCDVDERTWTIDIQDAERRIDKKTKAIIPVHLFGNPCDMDAVLKFAKKYDLKVIEDACQGHGATIDGMRVGSFGHAAAFSFYPTKNLGALGDGGMVTTNNKKLADLIRRLRHGGQTKRFWHQYHGINSRLDEIQAAILELKLEELEKNNKKRQLLAKRYKKALQDLPLNFQQNLERTSSIYHLFVIGTSRRNALKKFLTEKSIISDVYYPFPIYMQPAFSKFKGGKLPVCEKLSKDLLAIPLFPTFSFVKQDYIIKNI